MLKKKINKLKQSQIILTQRCEKTSTKLNVGKTYKTPTQENEKSSPTSKLFGVKWCEIHKEWSYKGSNGLNRN